MSSQQTTMTLWGSREVIPQISCSWVPHLLIQVVFLHLVIVGFDSSIQVNNAMFQSTNETRLNSVIWILRDILVDWKLQVCV